MSAGYPAYLEFVDFIAGGTTPEQIVAYRASAATQERVSELFSRREQGLFSSAQEAELEDFLQLEHILIMAKAQARRHLKLA